MATSEKSVFINRPPQEVFDFVSDPANNAQWQGSLISSEWTSEGPVGVGSTQRSVDRFLGRKIETTTKITIWDPPSQMGFKSIGGRFPFEFTMKHESKENGTQLTVRGTAEFGGFFKLAEGLVARQARKQFDTDFEALKVVLEAG